MRKYCLQVLAELEHESIAILNLDTIMGDEKLYDAIPERSRTMQTRCLASVSKAARKTKQKTEN